MPQTIIQAGIALDARRTIDLLIQLLQAITYLHHHHRILHRDLKPNNVLVNQSGLVQVLDFGLAVKAGEYQDQAGTVQALDRILAPILSLMTGEGISVSISTVWREDRGLNLNDWLLVCADAAILEVHEGDWRFTHDKLHEQILADLDAEQLRVLCSQVEKAYNALYAGAK